MYMVKDEEVVETEEKIVNPEEEEREEVKKETQKKILNVESWQPKTELGRKVKSGEIKNVDEILDNGMKIMEPEIVDMLVPDLETDLLLVGQSKGKFGGGQRRIFKQTQKKTREGNKPRFATVAVVGNHNGIIGIGYGKSKETVPAREKAIRNAKLNIMKIRRGCGSWECSCGKAHTIPFEISGKCGSVKLKLMPSPKGTGLCIEKECQKILNLAGIKDIWSKSFGRTKINLIYACVDALTSLTKTKIKNDYYDTLGIVEGQIKEEENESGKQQGKK